MLHTVIRFRRCDWFRHRTLTFSCTLRYTRTGTQICRASLWQHHSYRLRHRNIAGNNRDQKCSIKTTWHFIHRFSERTSLQLQPIICPAHYRTVNYSRFMVPPSEQVHLLVLFLCRWMTLCGSIGYHIVILYSFPLHLCACNVYSNLHQILFESPALKTYGKTVFF